MNLSETQAGITDREATTFFPEINGGKDFLIQRKEGDEILGMPLRFFVCKTVRSFSKVMSLLQIEYSKTAGLVEIWF